MFVNTVKVQSAKDMYDAVIERADSMDIIVKAAAVADYRPKNVSSEKVKNRTVICRLNLNVQTIY